MTPYVERFLSPSPSDGYELLQRSKNHFQKYMINHADSKSFSNSNDSGNDTCEYLQHTQTGKVTFSNNKYHNASKIMQNKVKNIAKKLYKNRNKKRLKAFLVEHELKTMDISKLKKMRDQAHLNRKFERIIEFMDNRAGYMVPLMNSSDSSDDGKIPKSRSKSICTK